MCRVGAEGKTKQVKWEGVRQIVCELTWSWMGVASEAMGNDYGQRL